MVFFSCRCSELFSCLRFECLFFFQAEDGIRSRNVTGVQTCALPICRKKTTCRASSTNLTGFVKKSNGSVKTPPPSTTRSEERRVGKSVDCGGRLMIYKKKSKKIRQERDKTE